MGEWGMGISLWTAANIRIQDVSVSACWGDNIFIGNRPLFSGEYSTDVWVRNCSLTSARRNGISVVAGQRVNIFSNKITYIEDPKYNISSEIIMSKMKEILEKRRTKNE